MSYGAKYTITWKNRESVNFSIVLLLKDYGGDFIKLTGSEHPFILKSQAQDNVIPYGIKATEATIEFYSDDLVSLIDFYNEDDTAWQVFCSNSDTDEVIFWGFLQLDNCNEQITDISHIISLNANDGLGRLQTQYFIDTGTFTLNQPLIRNWTLTELVLGYLLPSVGLDIDVKAWINIYENSTDDRSVTDYLTFFPQTAFSTKYFINDDGTTQNLYDALNNILIDFRCMLTQADGFWQIIRWGDVRIFDDGTMPGTLYGNSGGSYSEIFFDASLDVGRGIDNLPINENQDSRILRPFQFSKETFNYAQPPFITQATLQLPLGATPYSTSTTLGIRTDLYDIPTYFPSWVQRGGIPSHLEVVTDTNVTPEREIDRYIVVEGVGATEGGIQFNPIEVAQNDIFEVSFSIKTLAAVGNANFEVRFFVIAGDNTFWALARDESGGSASMRWNGPWPADTWDTTAHGSFPELFMRFSYNDTGTPPQWQSVDSNNNVDLSFNTQLCPIDGVLLMQVNGTNLLSDARHDMAFKDINLIVNQNINAANQIIGQTHNNSQATVIKNNLQYDVVFDDSPANTITGTLFTDALTNFDYTDINTGATTDIGDLYFTRTYNWHRQGVTESRRLGDLNTFNDLFIQRKIRTIVEGDFYGVNDISLMRLINLTWLSPKKFIVGTITIDYMNCIWHATLYEIFETGEVDGDLTNTYLFNYIYQTK